MKSYKKYIKDLLELCKDWRGIHSYRHKKRLVVSRRKWCGPPLVDYYFVVRKVSTQRGRVRFEILRYKSCFEIICKCSSNFTDVGYIIKLNKFPRLRLLLAISKICFWGLDRWIFIYRGVLLMR